MTRRHSQPHAADAAASGKGFPRARCQRLPITQVWCAQVRDYVRRRRWVRRRVREGTAAAAAAGPTPLLPLANMLGDAAGAVGDLAQDSARRLKEAAAAAAEGAQVRPRAPRAPTASAAGDLSHTTTPRPRRASPVAAEGAKVRVSYSTLFCACWLNLVQDHARCISLGAAQCTRRPKESSPSRRGGRAGAC